MVVRNYLHNTFTLNSFLASGGIPLFAWQTYIPICCRFIFVILRTDPTALLTKYFKDTKFIFVYIVSSLCPTLHPNMFITQMRILAIPLQDPSGTAFPSLLFQLIVGFGFPNAAQVSFK